MIEEKIDELRERLHSLINENADYKKVLAASEELDNFISEFTSKDLKNEKKKNE